MIAAAVNRYFGYFLVKEVRLSVEPFTAPVAPAKAEGVAPEVSRDAGAAVAEVDDPGLKDALRGLGEALMSRKRR